MTPSINTSPRAGLSICEQLAMVGTAQKVAPYERPPAVRRPPGSHSRRVFDAMADGKVWHSTRAAEVFEIPLASARNALRRLCRQGVIVHVGFDYPNDHGHPRALFRRQVGEVTR